MSLHALGFHTNRTALAGLLFVAAGCGGAGATDSADRITLVQTIALDAPSVQLSKRQTRRMLATFRAANGNVIPYMEGEVWTTSDASIVGVNQDGDLEGIAVGGPVTVTVSANGHTATTSVTVTPLEVAMTAADSTLAIGQTVQIAGTPVDFKYAPIAGLPVTWSSSTPSVASVDANTGLLTGVATGTTTITATAGGMASHLLIEVGVPSEWDGRWSGTSPEATTTARVVQVSFDVVFGSVRDFKLTLVGTTAACSVTTSVAAGPYSVPISNGAISLTVVPPPNPAFGTTIPASSPAAITASFTSSTTLTGEHNSFSYGQVQCRLNGSNTVAFLAASIPASSLTATRQ